MAREVALEMALEMALVLRGAAPMEAAAARRVVDLEEAQGRVLTAAQVPVTRDPGAASQIMVGEAIQEAGRRTELALMPQPAPVRAAFQLCRANPESKVTSFVILDLQSVTERVHRLKCCDDCREGGAGLKASRPRLHGWVRRPRPCDSY